MFDQLEALHTLAEVGTMSRAASRLKISQSAVSRRIATLEGHLGKSLIEPQGRRVQLTPYGIHVLEHTRPLVAELKEVLSGEIASNTGTLTLAMSGGLLISWGAKTLAKIKKDNPGIELRLTTHHSFEAIDRVRSGETMLALCFGQSESAADLEALPVLQEKMVIVPSQLKKLRFPKSGELKLLATKTNSESWPSIKRQIKRHQVKWGVKLLVEQTDQTFPVITQLARHGFGHGMVSLSIAKALGVLEKEVTPFPSPGISVPVSLVGRRSTLARPIAQSFYMSLLKHIPKKG